MTPQQQVFALIVGIAILVLVLELVRRRRLREEYSWLWVVTGAVIFTLVVWYDLLVYLTRLIGAVLPTSTLFLFGLLFLILINVHYSVKISTLTNQVKDLAQRLAILQGEVQEQGRSDKAGDQPGEQR